MNTKVLERGCFYTKVCGHEGKGIHLKTEAINYSIENGAILCQEGIPLLPRYLTDERIACEIDETGFRSIDYFNRAAAGSFRILYPEFWGGIRFYLREGNELYTQNLKNARLLPFGFESEWEWGGRRFPYRQAVFDDCIMVQITAPEDQKKTIRFQMEFYEASFLTPQPDGDIRYRNGTKRNWKAWKTEHGFFCGGFTETDGGSCGICIGADFKFDAVRSERNFKYRLTGETLLPGKTHTFFFSFDTTTERAKEHCKNAVLNWRGQYEAQIARYQAVAEKAPVLKSPYPELNNFFSLAPMYHESLKVRKYPGAVRAKSTYYWVWGWDGMTSNDAAAYWGDLPFLRDMLAFYRDYADENGIAHAFSRNMTATDPAPLPAQGMYLTLLYLYHSNGGTIEEFYPFAKLIFDRMCAVEVKGSGFCSGTSLFPDHRALLDENGSDISGFNNTVFYCAARSMETLADAAGDPEESEKAEAISCRMEEHFMNLFYNEKVQYIACSVDSETFEKRDVFNSNSMKWENSFLKDLADPMSQNALSFFRDHIVTDAGLREIPSWCRAYDLDANQLHCWWPVTGEYFARLINQFDDRELIEKWISWVSYWTGNLLCPEGISCYVNTSTPPLDNWNCQNGTWHAYSMRGWYQAAVHSVVGVDADEGGLTFYPYGGEEMELSGFHYRGRQYTVRMAGSGRYIRTIAAEPFEVKGTNKLPDDMLSSGPSMITVYRTETNPWPVSVLDGVGIAITGFTLSETRLETELSGHGHRKLRFRVRTDAAECLHAYLDGIPADLSFLYDDTVSLSVNFRGRKTRHLLLIWEEETEQIIWHKEPAAAWQDGMPLGNGRIGLMVPGMAKRERIGLNEDTLWAGYPSESKKEGMADFFLKARELVLAGKKKEAQMLLENNFGDSLVQPYLPMGDLLITMEHADEYLNYRRILHLNTAESEVWYCTDGVCYHRQIFVSAPDQAAVVCFNTDVPGMLSFRIGLTSLLKHTVSEGNEGELVMDGICPVCLAAPGAKYSEDSLYYSDDPNRQGISFRTMVKVIPSGGTMETRNGTIFVKNASGAVIYLTVRTNFAGPHSHPRTGSEYKDACRADLERICLKPYEAVRLAHIFDYRSLYGRTSFSLAGKETIPFPETIQFPETTQFPETIKFPGTSLFPTGERLKRHREKKDTGLYQLLFHFGKYLLISCSRKGTQAANLQGIWNEKLLAPWSSNYTLNINTEMNYWPALRLNLSDCMEPLVRLIRGLKENGEKTAAQYYGASGFVSHHASDLWCTSYPSTNLIPGCGKWGLWPMSGGWLARSLFERFEYTADRDFLKEEVYPVLNGCARFYEAMLIPKDGALIFSPAASPENSFRDGGECVSLTASTEMTMAIVRDVFTMLVKSAALLGLSDPFAERIRDILPLLQGIRVGNDGRIQEWDQELEEAEPSHRHLSHLYALYPGEEIIPQRDSELKNACRLSLLARGSEGTGWSLAWKVNLWARLGDGKTAEELLDMQLRPVSSTETNLRGGGSYQSLLCAHPPFQIDGNFGVCAGIMEMLVRQDGNILYLLPALPAEWKSGYFRGMALKGGAILNLAWEDGIVTEAEILPERKREDYECR